MSSISHSVPDPLRSTSSGGMGMMVDRLRGRGGRAGKAAARGKQHEQGFLMLSLVELHVRRACGACVLDGFSFRDEDRAPQMA